MLTLFMKLGAAQPDKQINCKPYIKHKICIMFVKKTGNRRSTLARTYYLAR